MPSKMIGDDEEARALVVEKKSKKPPSDDEAEDDEDEFLEWADEMDVADEKRERADALDLAVRNGVNPLAPVGDDPPLQRRSTEYLKAYAQAKLDSGEWKR